MNPSLKTQGTAAPARTTVQNSKRGETHNTPCPKGKREPFPDFDKETLADIRGKLPQYLRALGVELKERGGKLVGKCPNTAHEDKHPSFAVLRDGKTCGCYPCSFLGDAFALSQWLGRSSDFPKAVREVAGVVGVHLPDDGQSPPRAATSAAKPIPRPKPEPPQLSDAERERIHLARLRFSDALHAGEPIIAEIAASLGLKVETLRWAAHGSSGLGLDGPAGLPPWLCYCYPQWLKWRNPHTNGPRFLSLVGKATAPWRWEWVKPETETVYLSEGESDCLALIEAGLERDGTAACVASPGTSFPPVWAPLFRGKRVVLCFHFDGPGTAAAATVAACLKGHASEILRWKGTASHE